MSNLTTVSARVCLFIMAIHEMFLEKHWQNTYYSLLTQLPFPLGTRCCRRQPNCIYGDASNHPLPFYLMLFDDK